MRPVMACWVAAWAVLAAAAASAQVGDQDRAWCENRYGDADDNEKKPSPGHPGPIEGCELAAGVRPA